MRASAVTKSLTAASANNIALTQTPLAAGAVTINGALASGGVATLDSQRNVLWTSAGDDRAVTMTLIGTDENGSPIKDSITGSNAGTAPFNLNFKTITSAVVSGATGGAITLGTNTIGSSPWKMFSDTIATPNMSLYAQLVSGSGNATVEYTYDPFLLPIPINGPASSIANGPNTLSPVAVAHPSMQGMTASTEGNINYTIHGYRLTINSGTGIWKLTTRQAGLASP